jgi:hypothetical protein
VLHCGGGSRVVADPVRLRAIGRASSPATNALHRRRRPSRDRPVLVKQLIGMGGACRIRRRERRVARRTATSGQAPTCLAGHADNHASIANPSLIRRKRVGNGLRGLVWMWGITLDPPKQLILNTGAAHHGQKPGECPSARSRRLGTYEAAPRGIPVRNRRPLKPRLPDAESVPPNRARWGCGVGHQCASCWMARRWHEACDAKGS